MLPSSQTDPPPLIIDWGNGLTVIVTSSFNIAEQLLSLIFVMIYVVVTLGLTKIESLVLYKVIELGAVATL